MMMRRKMQTVHAGLGPHDATRPPGRAPHRPIGSRRLVCGAIAVVVAATPMGCSRFKALLDRDKTQTRDNTNKTNPTAPNRSDPASPRRRAQVAGFDRPVTLFGDLPMREPTEYVARAATSLTQHTFVEEGVDSDPQISWDGESIVFASTRHNVNPDIYRKRVGGVAITQITSDPAADVQPALSPDGKRIAFASNRTGNWDIWIVQLDGRRPVQVTSGLEDDVHPSWSPDGGQLVYCTRPPRGQWELWVVDATAGGKKQFVGYGLFPQWSPVGSTILYQRARERGSRWFSIWTLELVDGEPRYPTEVASSSEYSLILPSWGTRAVRIAYCAVPKTPPATDGANPSAQDQPARADIWMVNRDGTGQVQLTDGYSMNFSPAWSPDGRIFFTRRRGNAETIWSLSPPEAVDQADFADQKPAVGEPVLAGGR